jgi:hypothetical protein
MEEDLVEKVEVEYAWAGDVERGVVTQRVFWQRFLD